MNRVSVYANMLHEVTKRLDKMAKKAAGYGIEFSYKCSPEYPKELSIYDVTPEGIVAVVKKCTVAAVDVDIECDGLISAGGWTVCAKIEHGGQGNIVTGFRGIEVPTEWYTLEPRCDHCGAKRHRSVTYMCKHESGEYRQVGSTCLKDYTGIDPSAAALWCEVMNIMNIGNECSVDEWEKHSSSRMYSTEVALSYACDAIDRNGYTRSSYNGSTSSQVAKMFDSDSIPSNKAKKEAAEICAWVIELDRQLKEWEKKYRENEGGGTDGPGVCPVSSYERNCIPLVLSGYSKVNHLGLVSYMPMDYRRYLENVERERSREERRLRESETSNYVGDVGQKITIKVSESMLLSQWESQFGTTWLYKFLDVDGNVYIWYASKSIDADCGDAIRATVKCHKERDGVKQTIITRCQVAA